MFDTKFIFGFDRDLDNLIHQSLISENAVPIWIGYISRFTKFREFIKRHLGTINTQTVEEYRCIKKYIASYGYLFFNYLSIANTNKTSDTIWLVELFEMVYRKLNVQRQEILIKMLENAFVKTDDKHMNYTLAYAFITHPVFIARYFTYRSELTNIDLELKTILGKVLCPNSGRIENNQYDEDVFNNSLLKNCEFFNYLFTINSKLVISFFKELLINNWSKTQVNGQIYIIDKINSYTILCNSMVILNYIITTNSDYSSNYLPISNHNRNQIDNTTETNDYNILYWLIFDYYKVSFYSLILQNLNNQNEMLMISEILRPTYRQNIDANNRYLMNARYNETLYSYFIDLISSNIIEKLDEDIIYDILFYINYGIENKNYPYSELFLKYVVRFCYHCLMLEYIKNPFIKIKIIKLLYLLEMFYNIKIQSILDKTNYRKMMDTFVKFSLYIDKMPGIDKHKEAYFYKTNILIMIRNSNEYILRDKSFVILLFNDVESIVHYTISAFSQVLINGNTVLLDTLKACEKIIESYLSGTKMRIEYLYSLFNDGFLKDNLELDIKYHLIKFIYGVVKNCYDRGSVVIKANVANSITGVNENKIWEIYRQNVIRPLLVDFEKILRIPGIIEMISRFYPDMPEFFKYIDKEFETDFFETYRVLHLDIKDIEFPDEMPEDFLDPLLFTPIRDPVILPESHVIMDRAVIQAHLAQGEYDPFNRQPLTMEQLIEYNNKIEQHQMVVAFIKKRDDWISHYRLHND